jgi:Concanavalin A-like lectin/glucanases superfamily
MKKNAIKIISSIVLATMITACQDLDRPELGDYPLDTGSYTPKDGEKLYASFENKYYLNSVSGAPAIKVGTPGLGMPKFGDYSFSGASNSYISFPLKDLYSNAGISFAFWYKVNASPDRAGIITINDNDNNADDNRNQGLRIFREGNTAKQRLKLNLGIGTAESWNDGGEINVDGNWVYVAITISPTTSKIYFNGVLQNTASYTSAFDFSTSNTMVIGSGAPSFTYWDHKSDLSLIDDLRVFNKELSQTEIQNLMQ